MPKMKETKHSKVPIVFRPSRIHADDVKFKDKCVGAASSAIQSVVVVEFLVLADESSHACLEWRRWHTRGVESPALPSEAADCFPAAGRGRSSGSAT